MNVVSNNCLGGFLYKFNGLQFTNPFIWCAILADSMYNMIKDWDNINFNNFEIEKSEFNESPNPLNTFKLVIDNKVDVHYTHYYFDKDITTPMVKGFDVWYDKIWEYVVDKYTSRLQRMNEPPSFVILGEYERNEPSLFDYTFEKEQKILNLNTNYKIVLITKYTEFLKYTDDTHLIIFDDTERGKIQNSFNPNPEYFCTKHQDQILNFIRTQ